MIKKAFLREVIYDWIDDNKIKNENELMNKLQDLYKFIKDHPENLMPTINFTAFQSAAQHGLGIAKMNHGTMFNFTYRKM